MTSLRRRVNSRRSIRIWISAVYIAGRKQYHVTHDGRYFRVHSAQTPLASICCGFVVQSKPEWSTKYNIGILQ